MMSPPSSPIVAPISSEATAKLVHALPPPTKLTLVITSDNDSANDVEFVSETVRPRPRKRRRTSAQLITPEKTPKKEASVSSGNIGVSFNPGPTTPTKYKREAKPITLSTPSILVTRTPSPPTATPAARPPRPPPLYSIPPYIPPLPPKKTRRPWNSKLFASFAQSLQHSFAFEDFADEHGLPVSEVFDVFSACVQLPLLAKSAEVLAKGGRKAKEAIKEFRNLRKEVRAIHNAEEALTREPTTEARASMG
jgi:hypothetical protein